MSVILLCFEKGCMMMMHYEVQCVWKFGRFYIIMAHQIQIWFPMLGTISAGAFLLILYKIKFVITY